MKLSKPNHVIFRSLMAVLAAIVFKAFTWVLFCTTIVLFDEFAFGITMPRMANEGLIWQTNSMLTGMAIYIGFEVFLRFPLFRRGKRGERKRRFLQNESRSMGSAVIFSMLHFGFLLLVLTSAFVSYSAFTGGALNWIGYAVGGFFTLMAYFQLRKFWKVNNGRTVLIFLVVGLLVFLFKPVSLEPSLLQYKNDFPWLFTDAELPVSSFGKTKYRRHEIEFHMWLQNDTVAVKLDNTICGKEDLFKYMADYRFPPFWKSRQIFGYVAGNIPIKEFAELRSVAVRLGQPRIYLACVESSMAEKWTSQKYTSIYSNPLFMKVMDTSKKRVPLPPLPPPPKAEDTFMVMASGIHLSGKSQTVQEVREKLSAAILEQKPIAYRMSLDAELNHLVNFQNLFNAVRQEVRDSISTADFQVSFDSLSTEDSRDVKKTFRLMIYEIPPDFQ